MSELTFDYSCSSGRPPTSLLRYTGLVLPGVRQVLGQVEPYARAWERGNADALGAQGPLWVALGDSMTQGIGASAHDRGWVGQLAGDLPGHRVINLSFNGARVADVLERQLPAMRALSARLGVVPDLVTVMIGSNDLFSRRWRPLLLESTGPMLARLPRGTVVANQPGGRSTAAEFNRLVDRAVDRQGLVLADFRDPRMRSWRGKVAADHFHPNDAGYAGMAQIMRETVLPR